VNRMSPQRLHCRILAFASLLTVTASSVLEAGAASVNRQVLYAFTLTHDGSPESYDEAMAVACLQGIINRKSPELYVLSRKNTRPQYWLDILSKDGRWLQGRELRPLPDIAAVVKLAGKRLKGAVIWDPAVPASINVATTIAELKPALS